MSNNDLITDTPANVKSPIFFFLFPCFNPRNKTLISHFPSLSNFFPRLFLSEGLNKWRRLAVAERQLPQPTKAPAAEQEESSGNDLSLRTKLLHTIALRRLSGTLVGSQNSSLIPPQSSSLPVLNGSFRRSFGNVFSLPQRRYHFLLQVLLLHIFSIGLYIRI